MGHTRIGRLNRSRQWRDVVGAFCAGADFDQISKQVLDAAGQGLNVERLSKDSAYQKAVELLVQMGVGAQTGNFVEHMRDCGIQLSDRPSAQELIAKLGDAVDDAAWAGDAIKTDLGDHAKQALANAITACMKAERAGELPGMPQRYDADIFNSFGTRANFAELNRVFISRTMAHSLNNYLAKILPNIVGRTERVMSVQELNASYKALQDHCYETGLVHKDYANEWLGKHSYQLKDMGPKEIKKHANFLVMKMMRALKYGRD
jgi:hypothetical protein